MSLAVYPNAIPYWNERRDLVDYVEARHVNGLQREVNALASVVGINPHIYNDSQIQTVEEEATPTPPEGMEEPDNVTWSTGIQYYNPSIRSVNHGTVSERLNTIERGANATVFRLAAGGFNIRPRDVNLSTRPRGIKFPKPAYSRHMGMYNGIGVTLRKSGFWVFQGSILLDLIGTSAQNVGWFQASIEVGTDWKDALDRQDHDGGRSYLAFNLTRMGFYAAGTRISLRFAHSSAVSQRVSRARLGGFLLREGL